MNFQANAVCSFKEFFQVAMTGAALMVGWTFIGGKLVYLINVVWKAVTNML
jgi:hypothetical protein